MNARQVLSTYFLVAGLYTLAAALIWGVNTLFLLDAGLDILEVFLANAAFTAGSVLFEIPTGVVADTGGRRRSFLLSVIILLGTTLAYVGVAEWGGGLFAFSAVSVVMGLGFTFYSGAVEAWPVPGGAEARPYGMAVDDQDRLWFVETGVMPNRFVGFDPATQDFFSITEIESGGRTVRHMYYHPPTREIWFGTDTNNIGRAQVP